MILLTKRTVIRIACSVCIIMQVPELAAERERESGSGYLMEQSGLLEESG